MRFCFGHRKLNIETLAGDREQEITKRFPACLFDRGAYNEK